MTTTSYTDQGRPAGTWYYRVTAFDAAGNTSAGSTQEAATIEPADETAPSVPGGLAASVAGSAVSLSWAASTDAVGVTGYTVHRSGTAGFDPSAATKVADVTTTSYTDQGRPAGTWYYRVTAFDAAGNTSAGSTAESATIAPPPGATEVAVVDVADTYTSSSSPSVDNGLSASLGVYGTPVNTAVLRFVLPAAPSGKVLSGASLRVRTTTIASAGSVNVERVRRASDSWSESGTLYANRPVVSGPVLGTLSAPAVNTAYDVALDASELAGVVGSTTLAIEGTGSDSLWLWSRQAAASQRPVLTLSFSDSGPVDSTAPSVPGGLAASVAGSAVSLSWAASTDEVGVTGYTVHRSGTAGFDPSAATKVADVTTTSYTDQGRPAGTWYYRVTAFDAAGNTSAGSTQEAATIASQPAGSSVTVMGVGDIACQPGTAVTSTTCRHGEVGSLIAAASPDRFIALGDIQYQQATLAQFMGTNGYNDTFGSFKATTLPVLGNHEYQDATNGYFDYFYGAGVNSGPFGARPEGYYSTSIGGWTFIGLNTECTLPGVTGGCGVGSAQYKWLQHQLTQSPNQCTIVASHHPRWSTGASHGSYPEMSALWDLLAANNVEAILAGHNHVAEVFKPIGVSGSGSTPTMDANGMRAFTSGGGGANFQNLTATSDPLMGALEARSRSAFGPLKMVLSPGGFSWEYLPISGMTFTQSGTTGSFSGSASCH